MGNRALSAAVFFDRDGVLNEPVLRDGVPHPPSPGELKLVPGARRALHLLRNHGFGIFVVTNQPDVRRGTRSRAEVDAINAVLARELPIDAFYVCDHDEVDGCNCRKPKPGLLMRAAADHFIDLRRSYLIGDRWKDVAAGQAAAVTTIFIDRSYRERQPDPAADVTVADLEGAVRAILNGACDGDGATETRRP